MITLEGVKKQYGEETTIGAEIADNPRAKSGRLRSARKLREAA